MMAHKISIITPVYNGEKFIGRCAASVLSEKERDFEYLIVDDGSTDSTGKLCDEIAAVDPRVRVFHTPNQGQSLARNYGMKYASGDYLAFVDADDELVWDGMRQMIDCLDNRLWDIVCGNYYTETDGKTSIDMTDLPSGEIVHSLEKGTVYQKIKTRSPFGYCWNKLYRRKFLEENRLDFDDIRKVYMEDTLFNLKVFAFNPSYCYCNQPVLTYHIQKKSASRRPEPQIAEKYITLFRNYAEFLESENKTEENMDLALPLAMRIFCWSLFSNIRYEGLNVKLMRQRIELFMSDSCFSKAVHEKKNIKYIRLIPSVAQRMMYGLCFRLMYRNRVGLLTALFTLGYPVMKLYADGLSVK